MRDVLRFVQGAVARKDFVPELTHYDIRNGRITGYNGHLLLSSPIDLDLTVRPKATTFAKAILTGLETDDGALSLYTTKAGRLAVKSAKFRAYVDCLHDAAELDAEPKGEEVEITPAVLEAITALAPFMGIDASRPWATGIMLRGESAFATNNICLVEYWHGCTIAEPINIPSVAIKEILRNGSDTPIRVQYDPGNSVTFHYDGERYMRTAVLSSDWPEKLHEYLAVTGDYQPMPEMVEGLATLKPFLGDGGHVHFKGDTIGTHPDADTGAEAAVEGLPDEPMCFHHSQLSLIAPVASEIDFSTYPKPCPFRGATMRGLLIGVRP